MCIERNGAIALDTCIAVMHRYLGQLDLKMFYESNTIIVRNSKATDFSL